MIQFVKNNWKYLVLIAIIVVLLGKNTNRRSLLPIAGGGSYESVSDMTVSSKMAAPMAMSESTPTDTSDRLVIQDTSLSLVVKNVSQSIGEIENQAQSFGGYMVDTHLSRPEEGGSGHITLRVPEDKRSEALASFRNLAVKIVSESVYGHDVTDEYVDLESRLEVLYQTKAKFQEIMAKAYQVADLLNVQRELINLQQQIDSIKGQQKYYEQSAKLSKITIYLSTDELSLPYAPTDAWRPAVIFKTAVRSLMLHLRQFGTVVIWLLVYSPIIIPAILILRWYRQKTKKL